MLVRIDCGQLITADRTMPFLSDAAILAEDGKITWIGPRSQCPAAAEAAEEYLDFSSQIVIPGLINAHGHSSLNCMRAASDADTFSVWAKELSPYTAHLTPEALSFGNELSVMEMLAGGTTFICDCTRYGVGLLSKAASSFGMRSLAGGLANSPEYRKDGTGNWDEMMRGNAETLEQFGNDPLVSIYVGAHSTYNCTDELLQRAKAEADRLGVPFVIHTAETKTEEETVLSRYGMRPVPWLDSLGVLDERTVLVHGVWLNDEEIELAAERKCSVIHCPVSNAKLGSGTARIRAMCRHGIRIGLGTDSMLSNNSLDMLEEMKAASLVDRVAYGQGCLSNEEIFHMATLGGAEALGLQDEIGSLEVGKQADMAVLSAYHPLGYSHYHRVLSDLIFYMNRGNVDATVIGGKLVYQSGKYMLRDGETVRRRAEAYFSLADQYKGLLKENG